VNPPTDGDSAPLHLLDDDEPLQEVNFEDIIGASILAVADESDTALEIVGAEMSSAMNDQVDDAAQFDDAEEISGSATDIAAAAVPDFALSTTPETDFSVTPEIAIPESCDVIATIPGTACTESVEATTDFGNLREFSGEYPVLAPDPRLMKPSDFLSGPSEACALRAQLLAAPEKMLGADEPTEEKTEPSKPSHQNTDDLVKFLLRMPKVN